MRYKTIVCKFCGNKAVVPTLRKIDYCDREDCKCKAHSEVSKQSFRKIHSSKNGNIGGLKMKEFKRAEATRGTVTRKVSPLSLNAEQQKKLLNFAEQMDYLRGEVIKEINKAKSDVDKMDGTDDKKLQEMIMHEVEFNYDDEDEDLPLELKRDLKKLAQSRKSRRQCKLYYQALCELGNNFQMRSAKNWVSAFEQGVKESRDIKDYISQLKGNSQIYAVKKQGKRGV